MAGLITRLLGGGESDDIDQMQARKQRARERGKRERRREFRETQLERESRKGRRKALSLTERAKDVAGKTADKVKEEASNFSLPEEGGGSDMGSGEAFLDDLGGGEEFLDDTGAGGEAFLDDTGSRERSFWTTSARRASLRTTTCLTFDHAHDHDKPHVTIRSGGG